MDGTSCFWFSYNGGPTKPIYPSDGLRRKLHIHYTITILTTVLPYNCWQYIFSVTPTAAEKSTASTNPQHPNKSIASTTPLHSTQTNQQLLHTTPTEPKQINSFFYNSTAPNKSKCSEKSTASTTSRLYSSWKINSFYKSTPQHPNKPTASTYNSHSTQTNLQLLQLPHHPNKSTASTTPQHPNKSTASTTPTAPKQINSF